MKGKGSTIHGATLVHVHSMAQLPFWYQLLWEEMHRYITPLPLGPGEGTLRCLLGGNPPNSLAGQCMPVKSGAGLLGAHSTPLRSLL